MSNIKVSLNDVDYHVVKFGLDVYPQIEIRDERTRLNIFYEKARDKWRDLYDQLAASENEYRISKAFRKVEGIAGPAVSLDTFVLTPRGPVMAFPLRLPEPAGNTENEHTYLDRFRDVRHDFFSIVPGRKILRVGLVRELVFSTGQTNCSNLISSQSEWSDARLVGGKRLHQNLDDKCNIRFTIQTCEIRRATQLPVGARVDEHISFGLQVQLDINNAEVRPMEEDDIDEVITRAISFWPDKLLEYIGSEAL